MLDTGEQGVHLESLQRLCSKYKTCQQWEVVLLQESCRLTEIQYAIVIHQLQKSTSLASRDGVANILTTRILTRDLNLDMYKHISINLDETIRKTPSVFFPVEFDESNPTKVQATDKEEVEEDCCPTCLEEYDKENPKITTKCNHGFHLSCILEWMERSDTCPICDREMVYETL